MTSLLSSGRVVPLFDPTAQPQSWNERMGVGEYAVLLSGVGIPLAESAAVAQGQAYAAIFASLEQAEACARVMTEAHAGLQCRIYDHEGLAKAPVREIRGAQYKGPSEMSQRFRRWGGAMLVLGGMLLAGIDWRSGFRYGWPGMVGLRLIPPGLLLVMIEVGIVLNAFQRRQRIAAVARADQS